MGWRPVSLIKYSHGPRILGSDDVHPFLLQVCSALLRGCLQCLAVLNVSRSVFSHRYGCLLATVAVLEPLLLMRCEVSEHRVIDGRRTGCCLRQSLTL